MERAQHKAQARDPSNFSGTKYISKFSFDSIPNDIILERVSKLGVSLGRSPSQISKSIKGIKELDLNRTLTMVKQKEEKVRANKRGRGV